VATWGDNSGRGLENQVGVIQEMMIDVRWGSVAPRAAVGDARARCLMVDVMWYA